LKKTETQHLNHLVGLFDHHKLQATQLGKQKSASVEQLKQHDPPQN
jgi:hypothetical protein